MDRLNYSMVLAGRLRELRIELFGEHGAPELARWLSLPTRTWLNYESGIIAPAWVLVRLAEVTSVDPAWLLSGKGPKYRPSPGPSGAEMGPSHS